MYPLEGMDGNPIGRNPKGGEYQQKESHWTGVLMEGIQQDGNNIGEESLLCAQLKFPPVKVSSRGDGTASAELAANEELYDKQSGL